MIQNQVRDTAGYEYFILLTSYLKVGKMSIDSPVRILARCAHFGTDVHSQRQKKKNSTATYIMS